MHSYLQDKQLQDSTAYLHAGKLPYGSKGLASVRPATNTRVSAEEFHLCFLLLLTLLEATPVGSKLVYLFHCGSFLKKVRLFFFFLEKGVEGFRVFGHLKWS